MLFARLSLTGKDGAERLGDSLLLPALVHA